MDHQIQGRGGEFEIPHVSLKHLERLPCRQSGVPGEKGFRPSAERHDLDGQVMLTIRALQRMQQPGPDKPSASRDEDALPGEGRQHLFWQFEHVLCRKIGRFFQCDQRGSQRAEIKG